MSFLLDPPLLVAAGALLDRYVEPRSRRNRAAGLVAGVVLTVSVMLYLGLLPWPWFGGWLGGTDWMLNSGLGTDLSRSAGTDVLAFWLFAAYPLWLTLGLEADLGGD